MILRAECHVKDRVEHQLHVASLGSDNQVVSDRLWLNIRSMIPSITRTPTINVTPSATLKAVSDEERTRWRMLFQAIENKFIGRLRGAVEVFEPLHPLRTARPRRRNGSPSTGTPCSEHASRMSCRITSGCGRRRWPSARRPARARADWPAPRHGHALLLADRKLRRPMIHAVSQADALQQFFCPLRFDAFAGKTHPQQHVLERRERRQAG